MDRFLKIQNFKTCQLAFEKWMNDNYNINVDSIVDIDRDKVLFEIMKDVKNEYVSNDTIDIKTLNNISLNKLQDVYIERLKLNASPNPKQLTNSSQLDRDKTLYGERPTVSLSVPLPTNTTNRDFTDVNKQYDLLMASRKPEQDGNTLQQQAMFQQKAIKESAIPEGDFEKMVSLARDEYLKTNIELQRPLIPENTQVIATTPLNYTREDNTVSYAPMDMHELLPAREDTDTQMQKAVIQQSTKRQTSYKYITINGFDRNWKLQHGRYNFSVNVDDFAYKYKNINYINFTQLIVPSEVFDQRYVIQSSSQKMNHHTNEHKLAYPYLLLKIDEINDVCDGLNKNIQQAFAKFVFVNSFRCPNGRGYVNLEPAQNEIKMCEQQNLGSLQRLTISILKPNGTLYSNALDDFAVSKIEYQCYNSMYLHVILDKYFDKNEFFISDTVIITGFSLYQPASATNDLKEYDFKNMATFVNRPEGHDIIQLGDANSNGYYKSFYILAPGVLDQTIGKLSINKSWVDALREYNLLTPLQPANGKLLNMSLQMVLSMTIGTNVGTVKHNMPV